MVKSKIFLVTGLAILALVGCGPKSAEHSAAPVEQPSITPDIPYATGPTNPPGSMKGPIEAPGGEGTAAVTEKETVQLTLPQN